MFQVKRKIPLKSLNLDKYDDWPSIFKEYYHVDTILRANEQLWMCNEIQTIDYVEISN